VAYFFALRFWAPPAHRWWSTRSPVSVPFLILRQERQEQQQRRYRPPDRANPRDRHRPPPELLRSLRSEDRKTPRWPRPCRVRAGRGQGSPGGPLRASRGLGRPILRPDPPARQRAPERSEPARTLGVRDQVPRVHRSGALATVDNRVGSPPVHAVGCPGPRRGCRGVARSFR
jgi:hypothetical protein